MGTEPHSQGTPLTIAHVEQRLAGRPPVLIPPPEGVTRAAVLILLTEGPGGAEVLLTVRSQDVRHHKGQVSFPGGVTEDGDQDELATAVRETVEEVGLDPASTRVLGRLDDYVTITSYHVTPFVAAMPSFAGLRPMTDEIVELFSFPIAFMADPRNVERVPLERLGRAEEVLFVQFGDRQIWGATARMLNNLLEVVT